MRQLKRTDFGGFKDAEKGNHVTCPKMYSQSEGVCNCCQDDCAWFKVIEQYGTPMQKNVCVCGDKVIGQLA